MKKLLLCLFALTLGLGMKAQCPLTTAVDFTATDVHGTEVHLFDILDGGQYVLIDFFFTTCGECNNTCPRIVQSYYSFGCNQHDVFYMEIATGDSDAACLNWVANYGVEYPTISGQAGGTGICNAYGISMYPTVILIAPDHSIVIQDLYPIPNAQTVVNALEAKGVHQHACGPVPEVSIYVDQVLETEVTATFTPNEVCTSYSYMMATESEIQEWMGIAGLALPEYLHTYGFPGDETISHTFTDLIPNTDYVIYAVPVDEEGNLYEVVQEPVTTTPGGSTEIMPDFTGTDIDGNEIHLYDILDGGQAVLINFFLAGDEYSEAVMPVMIESYHLYGCNAHDVFYMEISPNGDNTACKDWVNQFGVAYPTISRDGGGNDIAQSVPVALYPTLLLIRPNHEIAIRDIYPPTLEYIVDAFDGEGYEQFECFDDHLVITPDTLYYTLAGNALDHYQDLFISNHTGQDVTIHSFNADGLFFECRHGEEIVTNGMTIASGESVTITVFIDVPIKIILTEELQITTSIGDYEVIIYANVLMDVNECQPTLSLSPNPANDFVTLKGENLGMVSVYNALGQKLDEFIMEGDELNINTSKYESGVYLIKSGEKTLRFVVTH